MDKQKFADWLSAEIDRRKWTPATLAREAGVSRQTISQYLNLQRDKPDERILRKLAQALVVAPEEIFEVAEYLPPAPRANRITRRIAQILDQVPENDQEEILRFAEYVARKSADVKETRPQT